MSPRRLPLRALLAGALALTGCIDFDAERARACARAGADAATCEAPPACAGGGACDAALEAGPADADAAVQAALVGTAFPHALAVRVQDAQGAPVAGVAVHFRAPALGASASFVEGGGPEATAWTDAQGVARAALAANAHAGSYVVQAQAEGAARPVLFTLGNLASAPHAVQALGPARLAVRVGEALPALQVRVLDAAGRGVAGAAVAFAVESTGAAGAAFTGHASAQADAEGVAVLPACAANTRAGAYRVVARASASMAPAAVEVENVPGAPEALALVSSADALRATVAAAFGPVRLRVTDAHGNGAGGAEVALHLERPGAAWAAFADGAEAGAARADAAGLVDVGGLVAGERAGEVHLVARAGAAALTLALQLVPAAPHLVVEPASDGQHALVHTRYGTPLALRVLDAYGNPHPGARVAFAPEAPGGASAPGCSFHARGGPTTTEAVADAAGTVALEAWANGQAGTHRVRASDPTGRAAPVLLTLTNRDLLELP